MSSHQGSAVASRAVPSYRARQSSAAQVPMRRTGSRVSRRRVRRVRERRGPAGGGGGAHMRGGGGGGAGGGPRVGSGGGGEAGSGPGGPSSGSRDTAHVVLSRHAPCGTRGMTEARRCRGGEGNGPPRGAVAMSRE